MNYLTDRERRRARLNMLAVLIAAALLLIALHLGGAVEPELLIHDSTTNS